MTENEANQIRQMLDSLSRRGDKSLETWIALVEDKLRAVLPADSQLLARFVAVKNGRLEPGPASAAPMGAPGVPVEPDVKGIILAAREFVETLPKTPEPKEAGEGLAQAVQHEITRQYFNSWPFRSIVVLFSISFLLVTGVAGLKLYDQVQGMQRLLDQAKADAEKSREQIAEAKNVVTNNQAALALLVLRGDEDLVKMRIKALQDVDTTRATTITELGAKREAAVKQIEDTAQGVIKTVGQKREQAIADVEKVGAAALVAVDAEVKADRAKLANAVESAVQGLSHAKSPWIPVVLWSSARWLVLFVFTAVLSIVAIVWSIVALTTTNRRMATAAFIVNAVGLATCAALVYWRL